MLLEIRAEHERAIAVAENENARRAAVVEAWNAAHPGRRPRKPVRVGVPHTFGPTTAVRVHATVRSALTAAMKAGEVSAPSWR